MAITCSGLTSGTDTTASATSASTASVTPTASRLVLAGFYVNNTLTGTPTCAGNGLTWVNVADVTFGDGTRRLLVYRAMGASPSAGAITITRANSDTWDNVAWSVAEFDGVDTTGTNGSGAIVNVETGNSSPVTDPFTLAFSPAMTSGNGAFSFWSIVGGAYPGTARSGWTEIHDTGVSGTLQVESQFIGTTDTDAGVNFNASGGGHSLGVAIELKSGSPPPTSTVLTALVKDSLGRVLSGRTVTFSSANTGVVTVSPASDSTDGAGEGTTTASSAGVGGPVNVTATCEGVSDTSAITVV
jgi:hypothetical protein